MAVKLLLSRLAFEAIRDSMPGGGNDLGYDAYTKGNYLDNPDYTTKAIAVWEGLNTGFQRLADYRKLPPFDTEVAIAKAEGGYFTAEAPENAQEILAVYQNQPHGKYVTFPFSFYLGSKIVIEGEPKGDKAMVEYLKAFPAFSDSDIVPTLTAGDPNPDNPQEIVTDYLDRNIDLAKEYHVTPQAFAYLKLYGESSIVKTYDPDQGENLVQKAENYLADMRETKPIHRQNSVFHRFGF